MFLSLLAVFDIELFLDNNWCVYCSSYRDVSHVNYAKLLKCTDLGIHFEKLRVIEHVLKKFLIYNSNKCNSVTSFVDCMFDFLWRILMCLTSIPTSIFKVYLKLKVNYVCNCRWMWPIENDIVLYYYKIVCLTDESLGSKLQKLQYKSSFDNNILVS